MKHVPFFRWVVAVGLVLFGSSIAVFLAAPEYPELKQVDLTVLSERSDGTCRVQWEDPYGTGRHEGPYLCDADRSPSLKSPNYQPNIAIGWDSGWVIAEGPDRGELFSPEQEWPGGAWSTASDTLVAVGTLLLAIGVIGGNIRSLSRLSGVSPRVVRLAGRLRGIAARVSEDHARAVRAVRDAWTPLYEEAVRERLERMPVAKLRRAGLVLLPAKELERGGIRSVQDVLDAGTWGVAEASGVGRRTAEKVSAAARRKAAGVRADTTVPLDTDPPGPRTAALLNALRVLVEAGPAARSTAEAGERLAGLLEQQLAAAAPAAGWRRMLDASREQRQGVPAAVAELRTLLLQAERHGDVERFGQVSVDLLRGMDGDPAGLAARVDFESRPAEYYGLLAEVVGAAPPRSAVSAGGTTTGSTAGGPGP
ncbi:hypothetical protein HTV45_02705 [Streptomyces sp. CHD11]|uniref:hypothetical protein n=1 Tax=Streptomyces sp. CHD11 TaxID=2741325 RepID=UPI001BFC111E|nr:hypothetical protein [Streptomyces sp. CHD11]MBT3149833.1 hypothetical protein [Streptomyces sp. CHD11]